MERERNSFGIVFHYWTHILFMILIFIAIDRNGMAERAQHLISRSQTSYTLWQKEIETTHSSGCVPKSDICLRVVEVLHSAYTSSSPGTSSSLRSILARCHVVSNVALHHPMEDPHHTGGYIPSAEGYVLFSFSAGGHNSRAGVTQVLNEGTYVYVWKPFYEVQLRSTPLTSFPVSEASPEPDVNHPTVATETLEKLQTALLCSRFLISSGQNLETKLRATDSKLGNYRS